jgi:hypothetical protein
MTAALALPMQTFLTDVEDDPVLAAIRSAPRASPEECELYRKLRAEVTSDPSTWTLSMEQLLATHPEAAHAERSSRK